MKYVVPATAANDAANQGVDVFPLGRPACTTRVRMLTLDPVYTAKVASIVPGAYVSSETVRLSGAVHLNQTVMPSVLTPCTGSPASFVAPRTDPVVAHVVPVRTRAFAKRSFAGAAAAALSAEASHTAARASA